MIRGAGQGSLLAAARRPLQASLAVLSVAAGVAALVIVVSSEDAWRRGLDRWYEQRGVNVIHVGSSWHPVQGLPGNAEETHLLLESCPSLSAATPVAEGRMMLKWGRQAKSCQVRGVLPGFERVSTPHLLRGRLFDRKDERDRAAVCVLDVALARIIFDDLDPLGRDVRIGGHRMRVVGIADDLTRGGLSEEAHLRFGGMEVYQEDVDAFQASMKGVIVPLATARSTLGLSVSKLLARADDHRLAIPELRRYLRVDERELGERRAVWSMADEKTAAVSARNRLRLFIGTAVMLTLLSTGIGLASVIYVAVDEQQREIGILRACGAARAAIGRVFLVGACWIGCLGGVVGSVLGLTGLRYVGAVGFPRTFEGYSEDPLRLATSLLPGTVVTASWQTSVLAAAMALAIAAAAAYLPAAEASNLDPGRAIAADLPRRHSLRRYLTGLQLVVALGVVLLLTSVHEGIALEQLGAIQSFSQSDTVLIELTPTRHRSEIVSVADPWRKLALDPREAEALLALSPAFRSMESQAYVWGEHYPLKSGRHILGGPEVGFEAVTAGYFESEDMQLVEGRFFTPGEVSAGSQAIVLTDKACLRLELDEACNKSVRLGGMLFRVVGVVQAGAEGASDYAYIPITGVPARWFAGFPYTGAKLRSHLMPDSRYATAERQLLAALERRLPKQTMDHVELRGNLPDRHRLSGLRRSAAIRASIIGFSALLIALIGLVNMLLVSVSEQTREIGLRRACGASRPAIAGMVLLEALVICLPGCMVGLGLGIAAAHLVGAWAKLSTAVPAFWIMVSAGTALLGGLLASLIPAVRAAMLHPVEALRTE